jgi:hypothetical protein
MQGASVDGLHTREEINVPVKMKLFYSAGSGTVQESDIGRDMIALVAGKPLHSFWKPDF